MSAVIAIANHKGGVAKTTTCLSLGGALAEQGAQVLLVDPGPSGPSDPLCWGFARRNSVTPSRRRCWSSNRSLRSAGRHRWPAWDLVPASGELVVLDKALYGHPGYEYRLREALGRMSVAYDFVLMDCPPSFGTLTVNALTAADMLIIPIQCEYYAWRSLRPMLELVTVGPAENQPCPPLPSPGDHVRCAEPHSSADPGANSPLFPSGHLPDDDPGRYPLARKSSP